MTAGGPITGASIVVHRRLEWAETDAAGHNHFTAAFRWMEEAEHQLWRCLGLPADFTERLPRVKVEMEYTSRIVFGDELTVTVRVGAVGRASCEFLVAVDKSDGERAATGRYVVVHVSDTASGSTPWPDDLRTALLAGTTWTVTPRILES